MFKITHTRLLLNFLMLFVLSIGFYACQQSESFTEPEENHISLFKQHLEDNTQNIIAQDLGEGQYEVTGKQGTRVVIDNALVNKAGERVRGDVDIVLVEIYTKTDMILSRKQTVAQVDGQLRLLESGGEIFIRVYQNGEELSLDGTGTMNLYLPTENTGGAKEGMELFYGEEIGEQVLWKPTGIAIKVVNTESRNGGEYLAILQNLGWSNVDLYGGEGEPVECIELIIECEGFCDEPGSEIINVGLYVHSINMAAEMPFDPSSGTYRICGQGQAFPLGGLQVTFIVVVECPDGSLAHIAMVTTTVNNGYHLEVVHCDHFVQMGPDEFQHAIEGLQ